MHELSLVESLIDQVLTVMEEHPGARVERIIVSVGALSGVEKEALLFCFPMACEGTALAGAELEIEEVPVSILCSSCGRESTIEMLMLVCSHCGSREVRVTGGRDFLLKELEVKE